jgi:hypothetical protein
MVFELHASLFECLCVCVCVLFVCVPWLDVRNLITLSEAFILYTIKPADLKFCFALPRCPLRSNGSHLFP